MEERYTCSCKRCRKNQPKWTGRLLDQIIKQYAAVVGRQLSLAKKAGKLDDKSMYCLYDCVREVGKLLTIRERLN